jgi:copper(I)-binding protein
VQVDEQLGLYHLMVHGVKQPLVKPEFIVRKVYFGKQKAFGKKVI